MDDSNTTRSEVPTRRDIVKGGGALVGGGLLAGCASDSSSDPTATDTIAETDTRTATDTSNTDDLYSVTMSPVGTVEFDGVPESVMTYNNVYVDSLVAFGHADALQSIGFADAWALTFDHYYEALPGVEFDPTPLTPLWTSDGVDKEIFYELDPEAILIDPHWLVGSELGWNWDDVDEIGQNVAPWFGNYYSREQNFEGNQRLSESEYVYYSAEELYGKFAEAFQATERWHALEAVRDELITKVKSGLPPADEAPSVGLVWFYDGQFTPFRLYQPGWGQSQYHHLNATDVFAEASETHAEGGYDATYGYESMLAFDPDVLLAFAGVRDVGDKGEASYEQSTVEVIKSHPVGSELTAAQNDRIYPGGAADQGPLWNIIQIEMAAKQLYPEVFGEFHMPAEVPEDEQLFDRQRVADIVTGEYSQ